MLRAWTVTDEGETLVIVLLGSEISDVQKGSVLLLPRLKHTEKKIDVPAVRVMWRRDEANARKAIGQLHQMDDKVAVETLRVLKEREERRGGLSPMEVAVRALETISQGAQDPRAVADQALDLVGKETHKL